MTPIRCRTIIAACAAIAVTLWAGGASAHLTGPGAAPGFLAGFAHPLGGADHVLAMLAVGVLAAVGGARLWVFPAAFIAAMIAGFAAATAGVALPFVETGIAGSLVALGLAIVLVGRVPAWALGALVAVCATLHGHAHGGELPALANPLAYAGGFAAATAMLHTAGIGFGHLLRRPQLTAGAGYGLAAAGVLFVAGI